MREKWKKILIVFVFLPILLFSQGCGAGEKTGDSNAPVVSYVVSFYTNSAETFNISNQTVQHGRLVRRPEDPKKQGYIFSGWYKDREFTQVWQFDIDTVTSNMTLYAHWIECV